MTYFQSVQAGRMISWQPIMKIKVPHVNREWFRHNGDEQRWRLIQHRSLKHLNYSWQAWDE